MKIVLPDDLNDITLGLYQQLMTLDKDSIDYEKDVFSLFTGLPKDEFLNVHKKDIDEIINHIANALQSQGEFKRTITIDGVDLGIIPNFDKITGGEYSDLVNYSSKEKDGYNEFLNKLIAVLYRPIKFKDEYDNYTLKKYNGTKEHLHLIDKMPMSTVNGCLVFFLTLSKELEAHIEAYILEAQQREHQL